jgi:hypothetical protein
MATQNDAAVMSDIEARKLSIERDANRRKVMWEEALRLAQSDEYPDALAVESELSSMGLIEAKHAFSEQDIKQIQEACRKAMNGSATKDATPRPTLQVVENEPAHERPNPVERPAAPVEPPPFRPTPVATASPAPEPPAAANSEPAPAATNGTRPAGIGRLARVSAAEAWGAEELDLAARIADNPDIAMETFGFTVTGPRRQVADGGAEYSTAVDSSGRKVLVESRLDRTANDQLGTMVANLAASEAQVAIWLVSESMPEHARAVQWLNESSTCLFFLVKLEAVRIGNSDPAPILTLVSGPSPQRIAN